MYFQMAMCVYARMWACISQDLKNDQRQKSWGWQSAHRDGGHICSIKRDVILNSVLWVLR